MKNRSSNPVKARPVRDSAEVRADEEKRRADLKRRQEEAREKREEARRRREDSPDFGESRAIVRPKNLLRPAALNHRRLDQMMDDGDGEYDATENDEEEIDPDDGEE